MKKMLSKVLALTLVVALGLSLVGGAFAAEPQTGTFDLVSECTDFAQMVTTVVITLDQPVGEATPEELASAFSVTLKNYDRNFYGFIIDGDMPRTVTGATVSEDGLTITLALSSTNDDSLFGSTDFKHFCDGYEVKLTTAVGDLTTDLALTWTGTITDEEADKWASVDLDLEGGTYAYRWFDPSAGYEMPEGGYPLIVWLHGAGESGSSHNYDNHAQIAANRVTAWGQAETQDLFDGAYVIAPQMHDKLNPTGWGWNAEAVMATILDFVDMVGEENVNMDGIVVGGCSMGGMGTWATVKAYPDFFAAAFPICGSTSFTGEDLVALKDMPIYLIHSIDDTTVAISGSTEAYDALTGAGNTTVYLALYDHVWYDALAEDALGMGHFSWIYAHNDFDGEKAGDKYWAETYEHANGVTYTSTKPAELGYTSFKAWLADQVRPESGTYFTLGREGVAFGEVISSLTIHNLPTKVKATETVTDYLAANPVVVTVEDAGMGFDPDILGFTSFGPAVREPIAVETTDDGWGLKLTFDAGYAFVDGLNGATHSYSVTLGGEEIPYGGDTSDTDAWGSFSPTVPEYTWRGTNKTTMDARYFVPDKETYPAPEDGYPLVVWLHGGGEVGTDNRIQITANDVTEWATDESQAVFGGAYVLAPQNHAAAGAGAPAATKSLIDQFVEKMGDIDTSRIYVGGCSYGGGSTWTMLKEYPNFFAAGFPHCGGTTLTDIDATNLINTPIYIAVSTGDGNAAGSNFISLYNQLKAAGSDVVHLGLFYHSEYDGCEPLSEVGSYIDHFVWVYFHEDFDGEGDDWDGKNWIASDVDGTYTYDGRRVEVVDGVLTAYWNTTDADGNTVENSLVLEGETENPVDLGYTSFKAWLADQKLADEYITVNKTVEPWGEIVGGLTLTLETPVVDTDTITVKVDIGGEELVEREIVDVVASEDGKTVTITLDKGLAFGEGFATTSNTKAYKGYEVTVDGRTITDIQGVTSEVDVFDSVTYTVPAYVLDKTGQTLTTMSARSFTPDKETYPAPENGYPLVIWLHGTGEIGTDNRIQIACADVPAWTEKEAQDIFGGAYVLAPQNHSYADQKGDKAPEATMSLIQQFMADNPDIDPTRIYVGGCSYGGRATFELIREYPNFFAAAFPTCASIYTPGTFEFLNDEELEWLLDVPIYMLVSSGDSASYNHSMITFYNNMMELGAENLHFAIFEHSRFDGDEYAAGYLDHWVWGYAHDNFDGLGEDWDGKMFIDSTVDGTYNDGKVVIEDGVYTYYYEWEGEQTSIVLNGETERPGDLGYDTFMEWVAAQVNPTPSVFDDVEGTDSYYDAVMAIYAAGVTTGTSATTYEPEAPLTRAEFVTFLTRALGVTVDNTADTGFTDVAVGSWETGSIAWGVANEILLGYGDGTFGPEDPVTEEQVNLIIGRLIEQETGVAGTEVIPNATTNPATRGLAATILAAFLAM